LLRFGKADFHRINGEFGIYKQETAIYTLEYIHVLILKEVKLPGLGGSCL
jgi:hypothetical protein